MSIRLARYAIGTPDGLYREVITPRTSAWMRQSGRAAKSADTHPEKRVVIAKPTT